MNPIGLGGLGYPGFEILGWNDAEILLASARLYARPQSPSQGAGSTAGWVSKGEMVRLRKGCRREQLCPGCLPHQTPQPAAPPSSVLLVTILFPMGT